MGMPALKLKPEGTVEESVVVERLVRVETNVEHLRQDVTELKTDVRRLDAKIDGLRDALTGKIDGLQDKLMPAIADLRVALANNRVWFVLKLVGAAVLVMGLIAKALKWI